MQILLSQLNAIPGVVGGLVCDAHGEVLAQNFPSLFDAGMMAQVASLLVDGSVGLECATGPVRLIDFRFADARLVVRPLAGGYLVFLCSSGADLQPLAVSTSLAVPQIEKRLAACQSGSGARVAGAGLAGENGPLAAAGEPAASAPGLSAPGLSAPELLTPAPALAALGPPPRPVPALYALVRRIEAVIEQRRLDRYRVRGEIALKAGFGLGFIDARTPDDPAMIAKLKAAASAILGESIEPG
jgi:predicted regulator of Ras-like GTPase activity (Roadblock/LC7/MglB family)